MSEVTTKHIRITDIVVPTRIRKRVEQIDELAADIQAHGLINPITVMDAGDGSYMLIAGKRRLDAVTRNGEETIRASVLCPIIADEVLALEYVENEQRQSFTASERLEYAERIKAIEQAKARERKQLYAGGRDPSAPLKGSSDTQHVVARPHVEKGKSRDVIAKRVGIGSGRQLERAMAVAVKRPDLMEKVDSGEISIYAAYNEVVDKAAPPTKPASRDIRAPDQPSVSHMPRVNDQVARAKHDRLMKNPIYADLFARLDAAVKEANCARGELRFQVEGYEKVIRGHKENIRAIIRERDQLLTENLTLRGRLGLSEKEPIVPETILSMGGHTHG